MSFGAAHFGDRVRPGGPVSAASGVGAARGGGFSTGGLSGRLEVTPFELDIRANIQKLAESIRLADEQLEDFLRQPRARRAAGLGGSLEGFLKRARHVVRETEDLFREWTVALAGEPAERHRKRVAQEKLQRAFDASLVQLRETERRCSSAQREASAPHSDRSCDRDRACDRGFAGDDRLDACPLGGSQDSWVSRDEESGLMGGQTSIMGNISREREEGIRNVQARVHEVSGIFRDFAALVGEQGQQFQAIETMASASSENTRGGLHELQNAAKRQRDDGSRFGCVGVVLLVMVGIVVVLRVAGLFGGDAGDVSAPAG